jgi:hypothetical protein
MSLRYRKVANAKAQMTNQARNPNEPEETLLTCRHLDLLEVQVG